MHSNCCFSFFSFVFHSFITFFQFYSRFTWSKYILHLLHSYSIRKSKWNIKDPYRWPLPKLKERGKKCNYMKTIKRKVHFLFGTFDCFWLFYYCFFLNVIWWWSACQRAINCYCCFCGFINLLLKICFLYTCRNMHTHTHTSVDTSTNPLIRREKFEILCEIFGEFPFKKMCN